MIKYGPTDSDSDVKKFQKFANKCRDFQLVLDGRAGVKTSDAFHELFGYYFEGDPRIEEIEKKTTVSRTLVETNGLMEIISKIKLQLNQIISIIEIKWIPYT